MATTIKGVCIQKAIKWKWWYESQYSKIKMDLLYACSHSFPGNSAWQLHYLIVYTFDCCDHPADGWSAFWPLDLLLSFHCITFPYHSILHHSLFYTPLIVATILLSDGPHFWSLNLLLCFITLYSHFYHSLFYYMTSCIRSWLLRLSCCWMVRLFGPQIISKFPLHFIQFLSSFFYSITSFILFLLLWPSAVRWSTFLALRFTPKFSLHYIFISFNSYHPLFYSITSCMHLWLLWPSCCWMVRFFMVMIPFPCHPHPHSISSHCHTHSIPFLFYCLLCTPLIVVLISLWDGPLFWLQYVYLIASYVFLWISHWKVRFFVHLHPFHL